MSAISLVNTFATTLVATQMTNITSEEKQNLLFDVKCPLEVQMEEIDSSTRQKENIPNEKQRITKTKPSGLCHTKIKVEWLVSLKIVKVERYK
ncbi:hypothetical protein GLOIN_2v1487159 [Rhizophagus clarus]|uniref:Uncharacterized protein n=1 Tax=Rhizophagus clarus TaxID=94130 RepID=A0A8H3M8Z6_9GLOM|nr:hypothetical protein GLOIN_2v1487159 [Rhizophagus clarus]